MKQNTRTPSAGSEPTVDLVGHFRGLTRVAPIAIVIALVVGVAVFGYQSFAATRYEASVVAQIVTPGSTASGQAGPTSTDAATAAGPFVALARDQQVLERIARMPGVDADPSQLATDVVVAASTVPGIIDVTADADSAQKASTLAAAVVATLDSTYVQRQAAATTAPVASDLSTTLQSLTTQLQALTSQLDGVIQSGGQASGILASLKTQIDQLRAQQQTTATTPQISTTTQRLILLASPAGGPKASSIPPIAVAAVAALVALILAAELLVLARSYLGRSVNREWARRVGRRAQATVDIPRDGEEISSASLATVARTTGPVLIVASEQVRGVVARIVALTRGRVDGRDVEDTDWTPGARDHALAIVVVREGQAGRTQVATALTTLAAWNIPTILVLAPRTRGTVSLPGGLAVAFRKPTDTTSSTITVKREPVRNTASQNGSGPSGAPPASPFPVAASPLAQSPLAQSPVGQSPVTQAPVIQQQAPAPDLASAPPITPHDPAAGYLPYRAFASESRGPVGMAPITPPAPQQTPQAPEAVVEPAPAEVIPVEEKAVEGKTAEAPETENNVPAPAEESPAQSDTSVTSDDETAADEARSSEGSDRAPQTTHS